ncbi:hypothetical protein [Kitasatospora sp. NBC_01300]|uniref:hypothetical protein n=1 Tax=Kitasatospora sp. NBC_01300 TaxID=2903574 RepID=UPI002F908A0F|nr:hypothetical protein OG556_40270 [Kitasatospora sp. NBC_01300]
MIVSVSLIAITGVLAGYQLWRHHVAYWRAAVFVVFGFCLDQTAMAPSIAAALHSVTGFFTNLAA